jgi:hypothetical protein
MYPRVDGVSNSIANWYWCRLIFTGLELASPLWETWDMAKYTPKVNDIVFMNDKSFVRYVVVAVNSGKSTADVRTVSGVTVLTRDVPWTILHRLDESQNALRIVREATEDR